MMMFYKKRIEFERDEMHKIVSYLERKYLNAPFNHLQGANFYRLWSIKKIIKKNVIRFLCSNRTYNLPNYYSIHFLVEFLKGSFSDYSLRIAEYT